MTADPQDTISEITEIRDEPLSEGSVAFFKAVACGGLAGGAIGAPLGIIVGTAVAMDGHLVTGLMFAVIPFLISGGLSLVAMVLTGLPLTALLHSRNAEQRLTYTGVGTIIGLLIPLIGCRLFGEGYFWGLDILLVFAGILAGGVTGHVWGDYRETLASERAAAHRIANPLHDMIY